MRLIIAYKLPYVRGGSDVRTHKGLDCSGLIWAGRPEVVKNREWMKRLRVDGAKTRSPLKRSTSTRMNAGLDGWDNEPVSLDDVKQMDLGFTPGHVFAFVEMRNGLLGIIHSRTSRGPTEEKMPEWLWKKGPWGKRLTIGGN